MTDTASLRPVVGSIVLDVAPPLIAYYGLRTCGLSEYTALVSATLLAGAKVLHDAWRRQRLDVFAGYLMLTFGLSLAVAVATSDARLLLAGNALVNGLGGIVFLASCLTGKPLTRVVVERLRTTEEPKLPGEEQFEHRVHVRLSALWGTGLLASTAAHLALILCLPVDVASGLGSAASVTATVALLVLTIIVARRARAQWTEIHAASGARAAEPTLD
jgi:hypothetical protein